MDPLKLTNCCIRSTSTISSTSTPCLFAVPRILYTQGGRSFDQQLSDRRRHLYATPGRARHFTTSRANRAVSSPDGLTPAASKPKASDTPNSISKPNPLDAITSRMRANASNPLRSRAQIDADLEAKLNSLSLGSSATSNHGKPPASALNLMSSMRSGSSSPSPSNLSADIASSYMRGEMPSSYKSDAAQPVALRLKPSLGRTSPVDYARGIDVTRAFRQLEYMCNRNNVKQDLNSQKYHVRRGQKRKDLKSRRWRKLFRAGFVAEIQRVQRMRDQGW